MTRFWLHGILAAVMVTCAAPAQAVEPYLEFVQGLRERRYYDYAMLYLDELEQRPDVPAEVRQAIPFEKATTLQQSARLIRNPDVKAEQLTQAEALLEQFVNANPLHPKAAQANSERARILLGRAQVETWQSRSPANSSKKAEYQARAREYVQKARNIFQQAHDQYLARWQSFPRYIDQNANRQQYEERRQAEVAYIRAQLDLALCTYEEAQTYDPEAPEFSKFLTQAALEFEEIHTKYRSLVAGLYARMWQGKCFEEQDEIRKALGVYNELLQHGKPAPGEPPKPVSPTMKQLQDQVLQFRLICLNHEERKDYQVVIQEASRWIGPRPPRTERGLAIMWERARAYESIGMKRTLPEADRTRYLNAALNDARYINRWPGQYRDVSTFMMQRVRVALDKNPQDPRDFDTAFGLGRNLYNQIKGFDDEIADPANSDKLAQLRRERDKHLEETARILKLALDLAEDDTELKQVNSARVHLSYVYYLRRESLKSAILGEFVARHFDKESAQIGLDAAYLAMAAYVQAYNDVPRKQSKEFELNQIKRVAEMITSTWPESDRANDARMQLGSILGQLNQPVEGARWYSQVPTSAPQYTKAQLAAGQSYWTAYLEVARLPEDDPQRQQHPVEELQRWQDASQKHLEAGIAKARTQLPQDAVSGEVFDEYIAAKVSLAQIHVNKGQYEEAINLLAGEPHPVMKAISVPEGTKRPENGVKSQEFAGLAYQLLLRGYVGTQQIDQALSAMQELERLAPGDGVMQIYVQPGRELEREVERLKQLGLTDRLAEVRSSFESFLNELYKRREGMPAGSLIWIAETYYGLAKGLGDDKAAASGYYNKAAETYQEIISNAELMGSDWIDPGRVVAVKLRLVNCRRRQGEFEPALDLITDVLEKNPKSLDAQFEAAYVLQDWGESDQGDSRKRLLEAINGLDLRDGKVRVWGWGYSAILLQRRLDAGLGNSEQERKMYEARYNSAWCRHRYANAQSSTPKKKEALAAARQELDAFVAISFDVPPDWQDKFNALYREVLTSMVDEGMTDDGQPIEVVDIDWPTEVVQAPPLAVAENGGRQEGDEVKVAQRSAEEESSLGIILTVVFGLALVGGAGFLMYRMWSQGTPKPYTYYAETAPVLSSQAARPARKKRAAGKQQGSQTSSRRQAANRSGSAAKPKKPPQNPS